MIKRQMERRSFTHQLMIIVMKMLELLLHLMFIELKLVLIKQKPKSIKRNNRIREQLSTYCHQLLKKLRK